MQIKNLLPLLLAVVVFSCERTQPSNVKLEDVTWVARKCTNGQNEDILCPYSFLRIYKNGTFVGGALRGFVSGTYQADSSIKQILLTPDSTFSSSDERMPTLIEIAHFSERYLNLAMIRDESDIATGNIIILKMKATYVSKEEDPLNPSMHVWRKKPIKPETPEEIKARTKSYLLFMKLFYQFASNNKIENPDTDWFPNVMNLESSGSVRLAYSTELKDWNQCFYNEEQAVEGYKLISGPFLAVKLQTNPDLNKRNVEVIDQILDGIK